MVANKMAQMMNMIRELSEVGRKITAKETDERAPDIVLTWPKILEQLASYFLVIDLPTVAKL